MLHQDNKHVEGFESQEYLTEDMCIIQWEQHYMRVDWFALDNHPEEFEFYDEEFGAVPKCITTYEGKQYVRTDVSQIGYN